MIYVPIMVFEGDVVRPKPEPKRARMLQTGRSSLARYGAKPAALVPSMHGQRVGRVVTVVLAIALTIATTGTAKGFHASDAASLHTETIAAHPSH